MRAALAVLAFLLLLTPALAAKVSLPGQVTYREKIALPTPATLRIQLVDQSLPTAPPRLDVEAPVASGQVPLNFTLTFEDAVIIPDHSYALVAAISVGGKLMFRNFKPYPVNPLAPASPVLIVTNLVGGPDAGSSSSAEPGPSTDTVKPAILDSTWTATMIGDVTLSGPNAPSLALVSNRRAGGSGGCNSWFSVVELDAQSVTFGGIASTKKSCGEARDATEKAYFTALTATATWAVAGDMLTLYDASGAALVVFVR